MKALVAAELAVVLMGFEVICSCVPAPATLLNALVVTDVTPVLVAVSV